ncbi:MAG: hypothetical protein LBT74_11570 [Acidobacteriota bacterium]|jgi:hypothetical protein|nr:hypothetical protein [Acidobacteriota bacterium]
MAAPPVQASAHEGEGRTRVCLSLGRVGADLVACLFNDAGHIGAVAVADYSDKDGRASVSVVTRLGHKEDAVAAEAARRLCKAVRRPVCAIAGIHLDDITDREVAQVVGNCEKLVARAIGQLAGGAVAPHPPVFDFDKGEGA